jgi:primosomal protein N' (replication factor Y) (superfamily II helicase)
MTAHRRIVQVAVPTALREDFDYWCDSDAVIGARVRVPFGRRDVVGFITGFRQSSPFLSKLKPVKEVIDRENPFPDELWDTLLFAARYYHHSLGSALATALPSVLREGFAAPDRGAWRFGAKPAVDSVRGAKRKALHEYLLSGEKSESELANVIENWRPAFKALEAAGLAYRYRASAFVPPTAATALALNIEQQNAVDAVRKASGFSGFVLDGVTGSGKTEVYLQLARDALAKDKTVLLLVPEIGLTPQTLQRFERGLAQLVVPMHSGLSDAERAYNWQLVRSGSARVVLGTRSAIFAPLQNLGLIVVDEEHDASYKQLEQFRYHARDLALKRAQTLQIPIVLGSATMSLESYSLCETGRLQRLRLTQRARAKSATSVQLVDVRGQSLDDGISTRALAAIKDTLMSGGQALILRNRRGFAVEYLCHECGYIAKCKGCDRALTVHRQRNELRCHYCERIEKLPKHCPSCSSLHVEAKGVGTERVEALLQKLYPEWPIERIDRDTTARKGSFETMLKRIRAGKPCLIVGTQMLAKGHDLPDVALVVVLGADAGLSRDDFRAPEHLAQLLIQTAGRAGRADRAGHVLVQTRQPEHPIMQAVVHQDYAAVLRWLVSERQATELPPYRHSAMLRADAASEVKLFQFLREAKQLFAKLAASSAIELRPGVFGPMPASLAKRNNQYRGQLMIIGKHRKTLHKVLQAWLPKLADIKPAQHYSLDVDPYDFS